MATLFLIRHGLAAQTGTILYGQAPGVPLDERGRAQAEGLADRFRPVRLTAIYSSPLERCIQTVEPLASVQRLPVISREGLIEMDAGSWTGRRLASLRRLRVWKEVQSAPSAFRFPDGESFEEALDRIVADIEAIARRHRRGRVAISTHGDIVRLVLCHIAGAPIDRFQRILVDPASVSVVAIDRYVPRILLVNDTGGLERFTGSTGARSHEASRDGRKRNLRG